MSSLVILAASVFEISYEKLDKHTTAAENSIPSTARVLAVVVCLSVCVCVSVSVSVGPPCCRAEMYARRVACFP